MLIRFASMVAVSASVALGASGSPFVEAANLLDGEWRADGFVLKIDSRRAQASLDPSRPFEWQRFVVKEVTEDEIVFTIGNELFQAEVQPEALTLTGTSFRGEKLLRRATDDGRLDLGTRGPLP